MEYAIPIALGITFGLSSCAAIGGSIAHIKKRRPLEGFALGLFLGPIGIVIESCLPVWTRPMIDQGAWHSFRTMVTYQAAADLPREARRSA